MEVFDDQLGVYDIDQMPTGRPRYARSGSALFSLTAHTRLVWAPSMERCLRRRELGAAMGLPTAPALACAYGMPCVTMEHL